VSPRELGRGFDLCDDVVPLLKINALMVGLQMRLYLKRYYGVLATQAYKYTVLVVDSKRRWNSSIFNRKLDDLANILRTGTPLLNVLSLESLHPCSYGTY
jgi:hypothetical protein